MEFNQRKKAVVDCFKLQMQDIDFKAGSIAFTKDRATIAFPNESRVLISLVTIKTGFAKGEFGAYLELIISGGPIYQALKGSGSEKNPSYQDDKIFAGTSYQIVPKGLNGYKFTGSVKSETRVKQMVKDIEQFFVPIIEKLTGEYDEALDHFLADPRFVVKPFCTCVVLLGLTNTLSRLDQVIAKVKQNKYFWDYHRSENPDLDAERIREWFQKRQLLARSD